MRRHCRLSAAMRALYPISHGPLTLLSFTVMRWADGAIRWHRRPRGCRRQLPRDGHIKSARCTSDGQRMSTTRCASPPVRTLTTGHTQARDVGYPAKYARVDATDGDARARNCAIASSNDALNAHHASPGTLAQFCFRHPYLGFFRTRYHHHPSSHQLVTHATYLQAI